DFIVFATGFGPNFDFLAIPEFEGDLNQLRKQQGLSTVSGLHFIGIPYQRSRSSQLIYGSQKDPAYIVSQLRVTQDQVMGYNRMSSSMPLSVSLCPLFLRSWKPPKR